MRAQADARKLTDKGLGALVRAARPPELDELAQRAWHCWSFCGGWAPERWPVYGALHTVPDWHLLIEAMRGLRE